MLEKKIALLTSVTFNNIGNGFIDLGPEGGVGGGTIVATGTPEEVAAVPESYTGQYLKEKLT